MYSQIPNRQISIFICVYIHMSRGQRCVSRGRNFGSEATNIGLQHVLEEELSLREKPITGTNADHEDASKQGFDKPLSIVL